MCVNIADVGEGRNTFRMQCKKGWKWSDKMRDLTKTQWCDKSHFGVLIKGKINVHMKNEKRDHLETKEFN